jgi:hypothetical protein
MRSDRIYVRSTGIEPRKIRKTTLELYQLTRTRKDYPYNQVTTHHNKRITNATTDEDVSPKRKVVSQDSTEGS